VERLRTFEREWTLSEVTQDDLPELARQLHIVVTGARRRGPNRVRHRYFEKVERWPPIIGPASGRTVTSCRETR
jgi:hypothetical protein